MKMIQIELTEIEAAELRSLLQESIAKHHTNEVPWTPAAMHRASILGKLGSQIEDHKPLIAYTNLMNAFVVAAPNANEAAKRLGGYVMQHTPGWVLVGFENEPHRSMSLYYQLTEQ